MEEYENLRIEVVIFEDKDVITESEGWGEDSPLN